MVAEIPKQEDLDWVKLSEDMNQLIIGETLKDKAARKFGQNPMVPVGCAATVAALSFGIYSFLQGRSMMSQYMMRARIVAQGFTVVAILFSLSVTLPKQE